MKKLTLLLVCSMGIAVSHSQIKRLYIREPFAQIFALKDTLKILYKDQLKLSSYTWDAKRNNANLKFNGPAGRELSVNIQGEDQGADPVMEKPGIKVVSKMEFIGRFLDLAKVYQQYIDPKADMEELKTRNGKKPHVYKAESSDAFKTWANLFGSLDSWHLVVTYDK